MLLNYLKNSFGKKANTLGKLLIIIGFILFLSSIFSSLFLIVLYVKNEMYLKSFPKPVVNNDIGVNIFNQNNLDNKKTKENKIIDS